MREGITIKRYAVLMIISLSLEGLCHENQIVHPAITKRAIELSVLKDYGTDSAEGLLIPFPVEDTAYPPCMTELTDDYENQIDMRVKQETSGLRPQKWKKDRPQSLKEWFVDGSMYEDVPSPRARHHFYEPLSNEGLDNYDVVSEAITSLIFWGSLFKYPNYYPMDMMGNSSFDQAVGLDQDIWAEPEPVGANKCIWSNVRHYYELAMSEGSEEDRKKNMATSLLIFGHICHLLEDTSVPGHVRNDFSWEHLCAGWNDNATQVRKHFWDGGSPFETWIEGKLIKNRNNLIWDYDGAITPFSKLRDLWDTNICNHIGNQGSPEYGPPPSTWGLAEATNYQFLSHSTIFKNDGSNQVFPHPAKSHTSPLPPVANIDGSYNYYIGGYGVTPLATVTYLSDKYGVGNAFVEDSAIFRSYANITMPRVLNYTASLINYFFRGRLEVVNTWGSFNDYSIHITVKNISTNSGIQQVLHNGKFYVVWEDAAGYRTQVDPDYLTVYQPGDNSDSILWDAMSDLEYNETTNAKLDLTFLGNIPLSAIKLILIYKGDISADRDNPDPLDMDAIAATMIINPNIFPRSVKMDVEGIVSCNTGTTYSSLGNELFPHYNTYYSNGGIRKFYSNTQNFNYTRGVGLRYRPGYGLEVITAAVFDDNSYGCYFFGACDDAYYSWYMGGEENYIGDRLPCIIYNDMSCCGELFLSIFYTFGTGGYIRAYDPIW